MLFINTFSKKIEIEEKEFDVGPIWGQYQADAKIKKYMNENNMFATGWHWSGHWNTKECDWGQTSHASFWRLKNPPKSRKLRNQSA